MEIAELKAEKREETGKGVAHRLRAAGKIPAVLYGNGESTPIIVDARDFAGLTRGEAGSHIIIRLLISGDKQKPTALIKETQIDRVRGGYLHIDFQQVAIDQDVTTSLPISTVGDAPGVKLGGILEHHLWSVDVQGKPADMPPHLEADVSSLMMGDNLHVRDLSIPSSVMVLTDADEVVVAVLAPKVVVPTAEEAAEAAEAEAAEAEAKEAEVIKPEEEARE